MPIIDMAARIPRARSPRARNPRRCFQVRRTFRLVAIVIVEVEVAMIRDEVDGWMDGWMLGKCCLFGVSDLFLTCF